jgi:6-phosphofructokinase
MLAYQAHCLLLVLLIETHSVEIIQRSCINVSFDENPCHATGHSNVMLVLQSCTDPLVLLIETHIVEIIQRSCINLLALEFDI